MLNIRLTRDALVGMTMSLLALVILISFGVMHLTGWSYPSGDATKNIYVLSAFDEGVYAESGALMAHGYQLYSQIYSAQPPVLPVVLSIVDRFTAGGLVEARWVILVAAILTVVGVMGIGTMTRGWLAGGLSALLLVLTPEFLVYSHAIEEEIPMTALCVLSLVCALGWRRSRDFELSALAGILLGLAVLTKFLAFALVAPLGVILVLTAWDSRSNLMPVVRDTGLFVGGAVLPLVLSLMVWGKAEWTQMIDDRLGATADQAQIQQVGSVHLIKLFLETDPGLAVLLGAAAVALLLRDWRLGLILNSWLAATLGVLLVYHPLFSHHLAVLLAPMATVAGVGLAVCFTSVQGSATRLRANWVRPFEPRATSSTLKRDLIPTPSSARRDQRLARTAMALGIAGVVGYLLLIPNQTAAYGRLLIPTSASDKQLAAVATTVNQTVGPTTLVAASDPMICVEAKRFCVPQMVDSSYVRVRTGKLANAIAYTRRANAGVVVLSRGLCQGPYMAGYVKWVHRNYHLLQPIGIDTPSYRRDGDGPPIYPCPFVQTAKGPRPAHPYWRAGIYAVGARGFPP
jgi:hypothetical protein